MATALSITKTAGNFVLTATIPEADIADGVRAFRQKEILANVAAACGKAHAGIQKTDAELDAEAAKALANAAEVKAGRATFNGV